MHTCHNMVQKHPSCVVGAKETHSFKVAVVRKWKSSLFTSRTLKNLLPPEVPETYDPTTQECLFDFEIFCSTRTVQI